MRKTIIKIIVCICVFVITLFIGSNVYNQGNADMTSEMRDASLPIVKMTRGGEAFNTLHGLRQEVDGCFMRDTLTPLGENRSLSFTIDKYGNTIDERPLKCAALMEPDWRKDEGHRLSGE